MRNWGPLFIVIEWSVDSYYFYVLIYLTYNCNLFYYDFENLDDVMALNDKKAEYEDVVVKAVREIFYLLKYIILYHSFRI